MLAKKSDMVGDMEEVHLPVMPYAYGSKLDGPNQFDNRFEGPTTKSNPPQKLEQDLLNEEATYNRKYSA